MLHRTLPRRPQTVFLWSERTARVTSRGLLRTGACRAQAAILHTGVRAVASLPIHPKSTAMLRTANPALKQNTFAGARAAAGEPAMTLQGTATKSLVLLLLTVFAASFTWNAVATGNPGILGPAVLVGG